MLWTLLINSSIEVDIDQNSFDANTNCFATRGGRANKLSSIQTLFLTHKRGHHFLKDEFDYSVLEGKMHLFQADSSSS